jgi:hypothetical protein
MTEILKSYFIQKNLSEVYLIGHSFGAFIAINFCSKYYTIIIIIIIIVLLVIIIIICIIISIINNTNKLF